VEAKRNAKDTVFSNMFKEPEYLLKLYKDLHSEDKEATVDILQEATIQNILTDRIYNDLGFIVRDKLIILVEAQSTWSVNILVRALLYLVQTYKDRFDAHKSNLYGTAPVDLPEPELYVIYTGNRKDHPATLSLSDEFFGGKETALNVTIKMLYGDDRTSIIGQYVRFCKVLNEQVDLHGRTCEAITETIRICKDENVLKDYLITHEQETINIMMDLFDEKRIQESYGYECEQRGEDRAFSLMQKLLIDGRIEDAKRVTTDPAFQKKMMKEYSLAQ